MSNSKKITVLILFLVIFAAICMFCAFMTFAVSAIGGNGYVDGIDSATLQDGSFNETVAVIDVNGVITSVPPSDLFGTETTDMTTNVIRKLDKAAANDSVKAILLRVDSPGGEVYASRLIYNKIKTVQDETEKPVVVLMENQAASGGYYISAPADHIIASDITLTGSIGVIFTTLDTSGLYDKIGLKEIRITNSEGDLKVLQDLDDPESPGYEILEGVADDVYENFITVVMDGRDLTRAEVSEFADGRVLSGTRAQELGLVDSIGEMEKAKEMVAEIAELDDPRFVLYQDNENSFQTFSVQLASLVRSISGTPETQSHLEAHYMLQY